MASKKWRLDVTINRYDCEEDLPQTNYDSSEELARALDLMFENMGQATSYVITVQPGKYKWEGEND